MALKVGSKYGREFLVDRKAPDTGTTYTQILQYEIRHKERILPWSNYLPLVMKVFIIIKFAQITSKKKLWLFQQNNIAQNFYLLILIALL